MTLRTSILALAALASMTTGNTAAGTTATFDRMRYWGSNESDAAFRATPSMFRNPILPGFHPDPSIVRVGTDYYLVNSSFSFFPGMPIFHSRDLVNWQQIGNAVDRPDMFDFHGLGIARGLFAPTLRHRAGTFYLVNACVDCGGSFIMTANSPAGPWSKPHWLPQIDGIDTDLFFDDDGRVWIANNGPPAGPPRYEGHRAIWIQQIDLKSFAMTGPRTVLIDGGVRPEDKPIWAEGPHIIKRNSWYYLIAAEGGTAGDHSQTVYRSRAVTGPYAPGPVNPILTQRDLDPARPFPVQATGHADFVETPMGDWWAVFLGTRPYEANLSNMGRETFLFPVVWPKGGWPLILPAKTALPLLTTRPNLAPSRPFARDAWHADFSRSALSPEWLMLRNPKTRWFRSGGGRLVLTPQLEGLDGKGNPAFLARRQQHGRVVFETRLRFVPSANGDRAGLAVFADERHFYFFGIARVDGASTLIVARRDSATDPAGGKIVARAPLNRGSPIDLRVRIQDGSITFESTSAGTDRETVLANADARILASEPTNLFTGTVIGPFAQRGR